MTTKKTTTAISSQQIYNKVCAIEKMLKERLETPNPSEKQPYLAAAGPEVPLTVIQLKDTPNFLPCFDESDVLYGLPDLPIMMSYNPTHVLEIGEEDYLTGPVIFFRIGPDGSTVSLHVGDLYYLAEFLESNSVILTNGVENLVSIRLD